MNFDDIGSLLSDILDGKDVKPKPPVTSITTTGDETTIVTRDKEAADAALEIVQAFAEPSAETVEELNAAGSTLVETPEVAAAEEAMPDLLAAAMSEEVATVATSPQVFADTAERTEADESPLPPMPTFTSEEVAATLDLRNFATLVTLNTARWHAKVKDRQASIDVANANEADAGAFETRKRLLAGADDKLKRIHKAIDAARAKHYEMTLPWTTTGIQDLGRRSGGRLLPNSLFFDYTKAMAEAKAEMVAALDDFVPAYPSLVEQAQKKLGKRFDRTEYPNAESIRQHFDLSFDFQPVPQGSDFKGLPKQQCDALARAIQDKTRTMVENAMQDLWVRLHDAVAHMAERLAHPDKMFHHTLVSNVRNLAHLLKHLNVTGDPRIEELRQYVEKHLCPHDVEVLRKQPTIRTQVAAHAQSALQKMEKVATHG